jgi:uncharacterized protein YkwD
VLEQLEERQVLSGYTPTPQEQLFLERLNDARANPTAYGQSIGVDLSYIASSQPLAFDTRLIQSSRDHSQDMNVNNYFGHTGSDGTSPFQRMSNVGFPWVGAAESIAAGQSSPETALQALIADVGVADLGHRKQLLSYSGTPYNQEQETGVGIVLNGTGSYHNYYTIDSGYTSDTRPFLTGVVYNDSNGNNLYDIGEGLGGVTITINGVGSFTTWPSGGYSYQLSPGTYTVTASGGGLSAPITRTVTVGNTNYRLNFINGQGGGGGGSNGTQIIDDGGAGFSATAGWLFASGPNYSEYYQSNTHYILGTSNSNEVATWSVSVTPGTYRVSANWVPFSNRATNASYTVKFNSTVLGASTINQQNAPSGFSDGGLVWQDLGGGTFTISSPGTLSVQLAGTGNGYLIADPMRFQQISGPSGPLAQVLAGSTAIANGGSDGFGTTFVNNPVTKTFTVKNAGGSTLTLSDPINLPAGFTLVSDFGSTSLAPGALTSFTVQLSAATAGSYSGTLSFGTNDPNDNPYSFAVSGTVVTTQILNDSAPGFTATPGWLFASGPNYTEYYGSDTHYIYGSPSSNDVATWTFNVGSGTYRVSATWAPYSNRATNAQYTVRVGGNVVGGSTINQQLGPAGFSDGGAAWQDLGAGTYSITGPGTLTVQLAGTGNGYLIADAVRVQRVGP